MKSGGYSLVRDIKGSESKIPPTEQTKLLKPFGISKIIFWTNIIEKGASYNMDRWGLD